MSNPESRHYHHLLFNRKMWKAQETTKTLRENRWLKPPLDTDYHNELHKEVPFVPVPSYTMAERIQKNFVPVLHDYIGSMDNLIKAVEITANHPKAHLLERELGELMLVSLLGQRPFVIEGLILPEEPMVA